MFVETKQKIYNNGNGNVTKLNMLTNLMQVPTNCSLDEYRDENNNEDNAMGEQQPNWSDNSNNNN